MKKFIFATILLMGTFLAVQSQGKADPDKKTDWWGDIDGFLNQQAKVTLSLVTESYN